METGDTYNLNPATPFKLQIVWLYFFRIVKDRTAPLALKNQNQANDPICLVLAFHELQSWWR
jgi:hypothetical protein